MENKFSGLIEELYSNKRRNAYIVRYNSEDDIPYIERNFDTLSIVERHKYSGESETYRLNLYDVSPISAAIISASHIKDNVYIACFYMPTQSEIALSSTVRNIRGFIYIDRFSLYSPDKHISAKFGELDIIECAQIYDKKMFQIRNEEETNIPLLFQQIKPLQTQTVHVITNVKSKDESIKVVSCYLLDAYKSYNNGAILFPDNIPYFMILDYYKQKPKASKYNFLTKTRLNYICFCGRYEDINVDAILNYFPDKLRKEFLSPVTGTSFIRMTAFNQELVDKLQSVWHMIGTRLLDILESNKLSLYDAHTIVSNLLSKDFETEDDMLNIIPKKFRK